MSTLLVLTAGGFVSWLLRITFIDLLPARKLPVRMRKALEGAGPAAMAALITGQFLHIGVGSADFVPAVLGTAGAALVTWKLKNLALTAIVGIAVFWLATLAL